VTGKTRLLWTLLGGAALLTGGCQRKEQDLRGAASGDAPLQPQVGTGVMDTTGLPPEGALARVAIGDLAGIGNNTLDADVRSPYAGDPAAISEGQDLFVRMN
jgi:hypothetical protein